MPKTTNLKLFRLKKAQQLAGKFVPSICIEIETELDSDPLTIAECQDIYKSEAKTLADALYKSLPGGTMDALIVEMLTRKAFPLAIPYLTDQS
ncbi:MAG: hypothetical protein ACXWT0_00020 [Methylobacter sp.]